MWGMPKSVVVPQELIERPFRVSEGSRVVGEPALRSARFARPFCGVRSVRVDESLLGRCEAYAVRMPVGAQCFSHVTAARLWGMPLPMGLEQDRRIHVASVDGTRPRPRGVVGHDLHAGAHRFGLRHGLPVTDVVSTFLALTAMLAFDDLVAVADHLLLVPRVPADGDLRPYACSEDLIAAVRRFHGRGKTIARSAVRWMRAGAESRQETLLRLDLLRAGLPAPELNVPILGGGRFLAYGDIVYSRWKVLVEYDGEQHRTSSAQYRRDIERHDDLVRAGWLFVRGGLHTPEVGPQSLPSQARAALLSRGWSAETSLSTPPGRFGRVK
jgi:very-short-patch-repair endonuclease